MDKFVITFFERSSSPNGEGKLIRRYRFIKGYWGTETVPALCIRQMTWVDQSPVGKQLRLNGVKYAYTTEFSSSIVADIEDEDLIVMIKLLGGPEIRVAKYEPILKPIRGLREPDRYKR